MGAYNYIQETFEKQAASRSPEYRARLIQMRKEPTVLRVEKPTNIPRARTLGYKSKQGFVVARVRVTRGGGIHTRPAMGRRPKRMGVNKLTRGKSNQVIGEEKAQRKFPNLEVFNSYWIAEDGKHKWFEVILIDPAHPSIRNDPNVSWITKSKHKGRVHRGKTSAGRRGRAMHQKGKGTEKTRPSIKSKKRQGK